MSRKNEKLKIKKYLSRVRKHTKKQKTKKKTKTNLGEEIGQHNRIRDMNQKQQFFFYE